MNFIKQWTFCVCITVILSVIFSLLTPKGNMGRFYKLIISLFIFVSFLYPFGEIKSDGFDLSAFNITNTAANNTDSIANDMIEEKIISVLNDNSVYSSSAKCVSSLNSNNEIEIKIITVSVPDGYDTDTVKNIIFDNLSLNVKVIHIGE